jgi:hypothetical protein
MESQVSSREERALLTWAGGADADRASDEALGARGVHVSPLALAPPQTGPDLVDLEVSRLRLREVVARFCKVSGYEVVVHPAVPATIRVTAKVYRVAAGWLLQTIAEQAGLRVQSESVTAKRTGTRAAKAHTRYYLVPAPQIIVVGAAPATQYILPANEVPRGQLRRADPTAGEMYLLKQGTSAGEFQMKPR